MLTLATATALTLSPSAVARLSPARTPVARTSPPLLMGKGRKKKGNKANGPSPEAAAAPAVPPPPPPPSTPPPAQPLSPAVAAYDIAASVPPPDIPPPTEPPPQYALSEPLMAVPPPADASPLAVPVGGAGGSDEALPQIDELPYADEPKFRLPSFEDSLRGPPKPPPPSASYESRLPSINQGKPDYDLGGEPEKTPFEKLIFRSAWAGIIFLVLIEIFINTPVFQQVKPTILSLVGSGGDY